MAFLACFHLNNMSWTLKGIVKITLTVNLALQCDAEPDGLVRTTLLRICWERLQRI